MAHMTEMFVSTPIEGYVGCCEAIREMVHRDLLGRITAPTLIIAGRHDPATTLEAAEYLHWNIPGSTLAVLDAAHISNLERPQDYADTVLKFLLKN
jgi:3-oxoadipate enol-lactonase